MRVVIPQDHHIGSCNSTTIDCLRMIDTTYKTICTNCGQIGTSCHYTLHFPRFTNRNDDSAAYCYYCPVCGRQVRIQQTIDGEVLAKIRKQPQYADRLPDPYYDTVADMLYQFYDSSRKYSVFKIPELELKCPRHNQPMLLSANWLAQPPLDCPRCSGIRFVVPFDEPTEM